MPAKAVRWEQLPDRMNVRLNQVLIDQYKPDEPAGYPTLCKGRFEVNDETYYALEEPTSLNVLEMLPDLIGIGVAAIKISLEERPSGGVVAGVEAGVLGWVDDAHVAFVHDTYADVLLADLEDAATDPEACAVPTCTGYAAVDGYCAPHADGI